MTGSYPALRELISRLEGKDRNVCETALYCLNAADRRDNRLRTKIETQSAEIRMLREALKPFADELKNWQDDIDDSVWVDDAFCIGNLRAAAAALK